MKPERTECEVYHRILDKADLAKALRVSVRTVEHWQWLGILVPIRIGHVVRFDWEDSMVAIKKHGMGGKGGNA